VQESANEVIFLHKIAPGSADKSYGIHVARLAGVPESVLVRAELVLRSLEGTSASASPDAGPTQPVLKPKRSLIREPIVVEPPEKPRKKNREPAGPSLFQEDPPG
jgi:DNA mismatch repair protein MutS